MKTCAEFLEKSSSAIFVVDRGSRIVFANKHAAALTGMASEKLVGRHFFELVGAGENPIALENVQLLSEGMLLYCGASGADAGYALMIHQLKTPLASIRWMCELLMERQSLTSEDRKALRDIYVANQRAIGIVNDVLQIAKLETGALPAAKKRVDIREPIATVVRMLSPEADAAEERVRVSVQAPRPAFADPELFTIAFTNLLDNAITYGAPNGAVRVHVAEDAGGMAYVVSVHNDGEAIPERERENLFTKFFRGFQARKVKPTGTGLGLYITKAAVEANGGRIWVESFPGKGTTFSFTVPIADAA
ncbi:MAG: PAS domain-containing sensor histidine kinase [Candidatus Harrisonbacteria bacterium]|nr:PAS domain-containing sensor histidine kinase [Candidatus Harrisonbacteria bacterium]